MSADQVKSTSGQRDQINPSNLDFCFPTGNGASTEPQLTLVNRCLDIDGLIPHLQSSVCLLYTRWVFCRPCQRVTETSLLLTDTELS